MSSACARVTSDATGPVGGVTVAGSWSSGPGSGGCVTAGDGTCTVTSSSFNQRTGTVTYTVTGLSRAGWIYQSGSNLESAITLTKP